MGDGVAAMRSAVPIGSTWREIETEVHRRYKAVVRTVQVIEHRADGRLRLAKVAGWGKAQYSVMHPDSLRAKYERVEATP